jgi:hypothetical protein
MYKRAEDIGLAAHAADCGDRLRESTSLDEVRIWYSSLLNELHSCLDSRFLFKARQGGPESQLFTPIKSASFQVDGGPAVRVRLDKTRSKTSSSYDLSLWVDAVHKDWGEI